MLTKGFWRDAILNEADSGGAGAGTVVVVENEQKPNESAAGDPTAEQLRADLAKVKADLAAANNESATRRRKLEALERADEERKTAELSDVEKEKNARIKAEGRATEAENRYRTILLRSAIEREATRLNFHDPVDAYVHINMDAVTLDDTGKVNGADTAVANLAKQKTYLVKPDRQGAPNINGNEGGGHNAPTTAREIANETLNKMYPKRKT